MQVLSFWSSFDGNIKMTSLNFVLIMLSESEINLLPFNYLPCIP